MRAGKLRHRLVIQKKSSGSPTRTSTGASGLTWATLLTVYGSLEPLSGERLETAQATWPKATVEARVRYRSEIMDADTAGSSMRISYGGRFFPIGKVLNHMERNQELRLLCEQGTARG
jgi:SPP1 family predicted phage head-tail adaptor